MYASACARSCVRRPPNLLPTLWLCLVGCHCTPSHANDAHSSASSGSCAACTLIARRSDDASPCAVTSGVDNATQAGNLAGALELLLGQEKKTRLGIDGAATAEVCSAVMRCCWEAADLKAFNAHIMILVKRRAQLTQAIGAVVKTSMEFVDKITDEAAKEEIVETLRTVAEGKIYVEVERARLAKIVSMAREAEGKIKEASELMQEVQVETFGSMDKREKADFILEQMRLTLLQRDHVRTHIISQKVNKKVIDEEGMEDIKVRYFRLLIELHLHQRKPYELAKDYEQIYNTATVKSVDAERTEALRNVALFLALSPMNNEQTDFMHKLLTDDNLEGLPAHKALLKALTTPLVIGWPLPQKAEADELAAHLSVVPGDSWEEDLHKRVVQHDVRVLAGCYTRLSSRRMAELLGLDAEAAEKALSEMVSDKLVWARIDRPAGIVSFAKPQDPSETLAAWAGDIGECLSLVEKTTHLINREFMVHGVPERA